MKKSSVIIYMTHLSSTTEESDSKSSNSKPLNSNISSKTENKVLNSKNEDNRCELDDLLEDILEEDTKEKEHPNFTGKWEMETNENVDKFSEEIGLSWPIRKAMPWLIVLMAVEHTSSGDITMMVNFKYVPYLFDSLLVHKMNNLPFKQKNPLGEDCVTISKWSEDGKTVLTELENVEYPIRSTQVKMFLKNQKLYMLETNKKGTVNTRIFKKVG